MSRNGRGSLVWRLLLCTALAAAAGPAVTPADAARAEESAAPADPTPAPVPAGVEERLQRLESELQATKDELRASKQKAEAQQRVLDRAGLTEDGEEKDIYSGLARFLEETQFEGWVTASYFWNLNRPGDQSRRGGNTGNPELGVRGDGLVFRQHPDHNTFQFDQAWFSMSRHAVEESRAGFAIDLVFGQTADALRGDEVVVYQAYAEYLAPLGPGIRFRAGRFASPLRVEPIGALHRFNITEGLVAFQLHPDTHTGATVSTQWGPARFMVGVANEALADPEGDFGDGKAVIWGVGYDVTDDIAVDITGIWGDNSILPGNSGFGVVAPRKATGQRLGIVDALIRWQPSELLTTYVDFTFLWTKDAISVQGGPPGTVNEIRGSPHAFGLVVGSHYMVTERTGFSFRGEGLWSRDNLLDPTLSTDANDDPLSRNFTLWSITGTLDHALTENAGFRVEGRWDAGNSTRPNDNVFFRDKGKNSAGVNDLRRHQWTAGVEAYYQF